MPRISTLLDTALRFIGLRTLKRYDYIGHTNITLFQSTDEKAKKSLADHFGIPYPLTLSSFRGIGGESFKCGKRSVFPPAGTNA